MGGAASNHPQAVRGRRLAFDPLAELRRPRIDRKVKPTFTTAELRILVGDEARWNLDRPRQEAEDAVKRTGSKGAAAEALGCSLATIYNRTAIEPKEDGWWLLSCLLAYTGMRAGEAAHLHWQDIRWDADVIALTLREGAIRRPRNCTSGRLTAGPTAPCG